jgi:hypothetical protein
MKLIIEIPFEDESRRSRRELASFIREAKRKDGVLHVDVGRRRFPAPSHPCSIITNVFAIRLQENGTRRSRVLRRPQTRRNFDGKE